MIICVDGIATAATTAPTTASTTVSTNKPKTISTNIVTLTSTSITTNSALICESFCAPGCKVFHRVKAGENPSQIAIDYGISYANLLLLNKNFANQYTVTLGMIICVDKTLIPVTSTTTTTTIKLTTLTTTTTTIKLTTLTTTTTTIKLTTLTTTSVSSSSTTTFTTTSNSNANLITYDEFLNAFTSNNYPIPLNSVEKYNNLIKNYQTAGEIKSKRELAMFLAQIMWESGGLRFVKEIRCESNGCPGEYKTNDDYPGVFYYGRGTH